MARWFLFENSFFVVDQIKTYCVTLLFIVMIRYEIKHFYMKIKIENFLILMLSDGLSCNRIGLWRENYHKIKCFAKVLNHSGLCRCCVLVQIVKKTNRTVCASKLIGLCTAGRAFFMSEAMV